MNKLQHLQYLNLNRPSRYADNITAIQAKPSLDLNFARNKSLMDRISGNNLVTFTRASGGTYVDSTGVLQTASTDVPRFDHNPTTGESLGLLVEEQRTNLLLQSENFATTWSALNVTPSTDTSLSPAGTLTADTLTPAASTAAHLISQSATVTASTAYSASVFVKSDGAPFVQIVYDNGASVGAFINVNLSTGAITRGPELANGATNATGSVVAVASGYYRISVGAAHTGTTGRVLISPLPAGQSAAGLNPSTTTAATDKIIVWGAQLEAGAFATSYIPTTTAAATRSADVASISGSNFSSWYRQDEGTVYFSTKTSFAVPIGSFPRVVQIQGATSNDRIEQSFYSSGQTVYIRTTTGVQAEWYSGYLAENGTTSSLAFAANSAAGSTNGAITGTDNVITVPAVDRMQIGAETAFANFLNGTISRLTYFPQRISNANLQRITQ